MRDTAKGGPPAEGGVIGDGEFESKQADDRTDQSLRLAQRQAKHGPQRQSCFDRQWRVVRLPARCRAGLGPPAGDGLVSEPDGEASALAQGGINTAASWSPDAAVSGCGGGDPHWL
jgi:hypothetical protein